MFLGTPILISYLLPALRRFILGSLLLGRFWRNPADTVHSRVDKLTGRVADGDGLFDSLDAVRAAGDELTWVCPFLHLMQLSDRLDLGLQALSLRSRGSQLLFCQARKCGRVGDPLAQLRVLRSPVHACLLR